MRRDACWSPPSIAPGRLALLALVILTQGCVAGRLTLPSGPGTPFTQFGPALVDTTERCRAIQTLAAELALSGRVGQARLRGRILAGLARPGSLRLEGVALFGPPAFLLAAQPGQSTLILPRAARVLVGTPAEDMLEALVGLSLTPDGLREVLTGCIPAGTLPVDGRAYGTTWIVIGTDRGDEVYLKDADGAHRLVAIRRGGLLAVYDDFRGRVPERVRLSVPATSNGVDVELTVRLSQVRINTTIDPHAFSLDIPEDTAPMTLDDLRQHGPLREDARQSPGA